MLKARSSNMIQENLFQGPGNGVPPRKFISTFRVALVKDRSVTFNRRCLSNSAQARPLICKLIEEHGNSDREQFCILMLSAKAEIIGLNIVSTGALFSAQVAPREVLKAAILANSAALILAHNHPSSDVQPSPEDMAVTEKIIKAASLLDIQVHEHLIVSLFDNNYYSFADNGIIKRIYDKLG
jgi:DNA repair protein RadC